MRLSLEPSIVRMSVTGVGHGRGAGEAEDGITVRATRGADGDAGA